MFDGENDNFCMVKFSAGPPYGLYIKFRGYRIQSCQSRMGV
ncbi:MAG: hypothetical protein ACK52J_01345 [bacterium]